MKNTDIEIDAVYMATPGDQGSNRYRTAVTGAKVTVLEVGVPLTGREGGAGHKGVRVRFERDYNAGWRGRLQAGSEVTLKSVMIRRPWTDEDDERNVQADAADTRAAEIRTHLDRLGLCDHDRFFIDGQEVSDEDRRVVLRQAHLDEDEAGITEIEADYSVTIAPTAEDVGVRFFGPGWRKLEAILNG